MRVRMKVDISGSRDGRPWPRRGEELELRDGEGADLCAAGIAEPVAQDEAVETAVAVDDAENRAMTTETAAAVTPSAPAAETEPQALAEAKSVAKKAAPAKKTAVKKTAAPRVAPAAEL